MNAAISQLNICKQNIHFTIYVAIEWRSLLMT